MDKGEGISQINDCATILDACLWIDEAVQACFAKVGFTNEIIDKDLEDNVPLLELIQATESHFNIDGPMDVVNEVTMDDNIPVADNNVNGYEKRLLTDFRTDNFT